MESLRGEEVVGGGRGVIERREGGGKESMRGEAGEESLHDVDSPVWGVDEGLIIHISRISWHT